MKSWYNLAKNGPAAELSIYDAIGAYGVSAAQFANELKALGTVEQLNIRINSPGGSIVDGNAIFNLLAQNPARKVVTVDGIAASMASVIAMVGDEIKMPSNALMMIHNPWTLAIGDSEELRKNADLLDKMKTGIVGAYSKRTGMSAEDVGALMDAETWMDGNEAVAKGFATELIGELKMAAAIDLSAFQNIDPRAAALLASKANEDKTKDEREPPAVSPTVAPVPPVGDAGSLVAKHEAELGARETIILDLRGQLDGLRAELATVNASLSGVKVELVAEQSAHRGTNATLENLKHRHEKMFAGAHYRPEDSYESWDQLVARLGYVQARAQFPATHLAWMKSKGISFK